MTTEEAAVDDDGGRKHHLVHFDRHTPDYRDRFEDITHELHGQCPIAWTEAHEIGRAHV